MNENVNAEAYKRIRKRLSALQNGAPLPNVVKEIGFRPDQRLDNGGLTINLKRSEQSSDGVFLPLYPELEDQQNPDFIALIELILS